MFCKNCGVKLNVGSTFCHNCGSIVNDNIYAVPPQTEPNAAPTCTPNYNTVAPQNIPNHPVYNMPVSQPQPAQMYGYVPYSAQEAPKKSIDGFSISSLVLGILGIQMLILSFILSPLAIIFGIIGRKKSKSAMATIGIILASVALLIMVVYIVATLTGLIQFSEESILESFNFFNDGLYF